MDETELSQAHKRARYNRDAVMDCAACGCFYCERVFPGSAVKSWADRGRTAVCPFCQMDAVLAGQDTDAAPAVLHAMRQRWFDRTHIINQV